MSAAAQLAVKLSVEGDGAVNSALKHVHDRLGKLGGAAAAPVKALGGLGSTLGDIAKLGAGFAVGGVFGAVASQIGSVGTAMISGNAEMERYETQLGTLMGGADKARERLAELAKFGASTPFELPEVVRAEKVLLGFGLTGQKAVQMTGRSGEELRTIIGDIAAGTGASFEEIALGFGKFSAGATGEAISRFQELGIVTREQMAAMGVQFSKSGELISPLPEAMAAAVKIANSKFGGGMKALSSTWEGQVSTLMDNWNALVRTVGQPIFEALKPQLAALNELLSSEAFQSGVTAFTTGLIAGVGGAVAAMQPFLAMLPDIGTALGQVFAFMRDGSGDIEVFRGILNKLLGPAGAQGVIDVFTNLVGFFRTAVVPLWQDLAGAVQKALSGDVVGALQDGAAALATYGGKLVESLAEWARRFIEWVAPMIPPLLAELGKLLVQLGGWLGTVALPAIAAKLLEWGQAFVAWVAPQIMPMLAALGQLLLDLNVWAYTVALPAIVAQLAEWGKAFVGWVATEVIPKLPGALKTVQDTVTGFLLAAGPIVLTEAGKVGKSLYDGFMAELARLAPAVWEAVAGDGPDSLKSKIAAGLKAAIDNAIVAVKSWIDDLIAPFRAAWKTISDLLSKIRGGRKEAEGGGESGGGGASASRVGAATALGGPTVGTQTNYVTINAGAANADQVAARVPVTLATLARTRVTAGVL